jgi:hypothetical protein
VVDGTEQPLSASFHPGVNTLLYSSKKKQHSITILLFVTMTGHIFYLSSSYGTPPDEPGTQHYCAFSSHCIIVKNVIAKIKDFHTTKDAMCSPVHDLPLILQQHQKIWTILAVIMNNYK